MPDKDAAEITAARRPQAGFDAKPATKKMIVRFYLDILLDRAAYFGLSQDQRTEAVASLETKIYCPADMTTIRQGWASDHVLDMTGFNGVGEAAHGAAAAAIAGYIASSCLLPALSMPALGAGFDGVRYTVRAGKRVCIYDYKLLDGETPAVFTGEHGLTAEVSFRAEVEAA